MNLTFHNWKFFSLLGMAVLSHEAVGSNANAPTFGGAGYDVYILAGQSNTLGTGTQEDFVPNEYLDSKILYLPEVGVGTPSGGDCVTTYDRGTELRRLSPTLISTNSGKRWGLELNFARLKQRDLDNSNSPDRGRRVAIIKFAFGATSLGEEWLNTSVCGTPLLHRLLHQIQNFKNQMEANGQAGKYRFKGIIWWQGESDTFRESDYANDKYFKNLNLVIHKIREVAHTGPSGSVNNSLPFVVTRIHRKNMNGRVRVDLKCYPNCFKIGWCEVRKQIVKTALSDRYGSWMNVDDLHYFDQEVIRNEHFPSAAYSFIGARAKNILDAFPSHGIVRTGAEIERVASDTAQCPGFDGKPSNWVDPNTCYYEANIPSPRPRHCPQYPYPGQKLPENQRVQQPL